MYLRQFVGEVGTGRCVCLAPQWRLLTCVYPAALATTEEHSIRDLLAASALYGCFTGCRVMARSVSLTWFVIFICLVFPNSLRIVLLFFFSFPTYGCTSIFWFSFGDPYIFRDTPQVLVFVFLMFGLTLDFRSCVFYEDANKVWFFEQAPMQP